MSRAYAQGPRSVWLDRYIDGMHTTRQIRDLIWAVQSRSLLANSPAVAGIDSSEAGAREIVPRQVDPDHLAAFLDQTAGHRVGRYFERLILYWLKHIRRVEIVAESLQIRDEHRTIGEIDLMFYDEQRRLTHWEIAVKFYLHFPQQCAVGSHFIGPNAADTFERKMDRLFGHQLPLSERKFPEVEIRQAFVKGRIFDHPRHEVSPELPEQLSPEHLCGVWIRSSELDLINRSNGVSYRILRKPFWLSDEIAHPADTDLLSPEELIASLARHFAGDHRPVLISQLAAGEPRLVESDRIFVVSDLWPNREHIV